MKIKERKKDYEEEDKVVKERKKERNLNDYKMRLFNVLILKEVPLSDSGRLN